MEENWEGEIRKDRGGRGRGRRDRQRTLHVVNERIVFSSPLGSGPRKFPLYTVGVSVNQDSH
jgi:hypothetical protein